jgi:hypothetical protein
MLGHDEECAKGVVEEYLRGADSRALYWATVLNVKLVAVEGSEPGDVAQRLMQHLKAKDAE